ncbi:MAG: permease-like cell division protein FtsX [Nitrospirota bacterium]
MKGYGLFFFVAEAFRGLRANSIVNLLAVGTISMAMLIVVFFLLVFLNLRPAVLSLGDRLEMSVYLKDGLSVGERDNLFARLKTEPGIKKITFLPKTEALGMFKKELKGHEALIQGLAGNPLPDSYELSIDPRAAHEQRLEALSKKIAEYPGVEDVAYGKRGAKILEGIYQWITYGGTALAILLGISVIFIISNSVRLALYSRGQEIELMQWIGATRGFIQGPFLIEGMMLSMLGSALAIGILASIFYLLPQDVVLFLSWPNKLDFLPPMAITSIILAGGILGFVGGYISVNRFLD